MKMIFADPKELALGAAEYFVAQMPETVALSGGSTPKLMFQILADQFRDEVDWSRMQFFWSDERHVPPDHPESNYRMANEALLSHVPVLANNIHRIYGENPNAAGAASEYEETIITVTKQPLPRVDLIFLGLGTDGHTASIFPGSEVLHETKRLVAAPYVEKFKSYRITMTLPLLNNGASVVFLVSGAEKAEIVKAVLEGENEYPAQAVKPVQGELIWMLDKEAASKLSSEFKL
jgi:6-phosphogluconolactonase